MENAMLLVPLVGGALVLAIVTRYVIARRRRRRSTDAALAWIRTISLAGNTLTTSPYAQVTRTTALLGESLQLRALRCQVRTLEQALEEEQCQPAGSTAPEDLETYRRQVHAVIRAMGGKAEAGDAASQMLVRVSAAIDRLALPASFERPVLGGSAGTATTAGSVGLLERTAVTGPMPSAARSELGEGPSTASFSTVEQGFSRDFVVDAAEPEVVLPVPPMAESGENRRGRRWFRGSAA